jgi:hypothetical protein
VIEDDLRAVRAHIERDPGAALRREAKRARRLERETLLLLPFAVLLGRVLLRGIELGQGGHLDRGGQRNGRSFEDQNRRRGERGKPEGLNASHRPSRWLEERSNERRNLRRATHPHKGRARAY